MIAATKNLCTIVAGRSVPARSNDAPSAEPSVEGVGIDRSNGRRNAAGERAAELQRRARRILGLRIEFVPHPMFREPAAERLVEEMKPLAAEAPADESCRSESETDVVRTLCRAPLLSTELERYLFCRMNLAKATACRLRQRLSENRPDGELLGRIEQLRAEAVAVRNRIVESNLRLVVSIAKRFGPSGDALDESVSEGILPLIRAVELFDVSRGTRFSTYATHAVRNHLLRVRKRARRAVANAAADTDLSEAVADPRAAQSRIDADVCDSMQIGELLVRLDRRERSILAARFGLHEFDREHTFLEIGQMVGLSKERTRILAHRAVEKLQACVVPD